MKKQNIYLLATITLVTVTTTMTFIGRPQVAAAAAGGSKDTEATVIIKQQSTPTKPMNPMTDPNKIDPKDPGSGNGIPGVGSEGLFIDSVPNFQFNQVTLDPAKTNEVYASPDQWKYNEKTKPAETIPNYLQVSDKRLAVGTWNIKVSASEMQSVDPKSKNKLAGATLTLQSLTLKDEQGRKDAELKTIITTGGEDILIPTTETAVLVMGSAKGADARGTFFAKFNEKKPEQGVKLSIPKQKGAIIDGERFKTKLRWTLEDTPL